MAFYRQDPEMAYCLKGLLDRFEKEGRPNLQENIAITCIRYEKKSPSTCSGYGTGWNSNRNFYPASVVKIVYALATHVWLQQDLIVDSEELRRALHEMIANSNNDATSYILDLLTGTTSGPSLNKSNYQAWTIQRQLINNWLEELQWPEIQNWNCSQKTWNEGPFGREKDFYGENNKNRNSMTTDGSARIFESLMTKEMLPKVASEKLIKNFLRSLDPFIRKQDLNNQVDGFLGEGLPYASKLWSKAGLMSEVRHDVAWWEAPNKNPMLVAVFTIGEKLVKDRFLLPAIGSELNKLAI
ncbi:serine hydrolase [Prochlorococcus marinus]|uniref:serine hydrolase n=1 Tax=Prochlorococcus marinus TaxID=1219 RepID=UPI0039AF2E7E